MPLILSVGKAVPKYKIDQENVVPFIRELFLKRYPSIDRLLSVFQNGEIQSRFISKELSWYSEEHSFEQKNQAYTEISIELTIEAIKNCVTSNEFLSSEVKYEEIDGIIFVSSTGISTPTIDAHIANILPFSSSIKRIPIWGLGCAGGASGISRAFDYCKAHPKSNILLVAVELCSLTFQKEDLSKSNIIGTSLFADGAAAVLVIGDESDLKNRTIHKSLPSIEQTNSTLMPNSLDVMGWDVRNDGLFVIFSRDIPSIVKNWLQPVVSNFLTENELTITNITHFIAHPGGKKVLDAYIESLNLSEAKIEISLNILKSYGNMSSCTVLFVLCEFMKLGKTNEYGLLCALGPGFSSELSLLKWVEC
ncbi:type III polyketide synthase [Gottfriedia acidiceleris]|uniref:type III polyketide synthase n=1 Tax=Gottfriedia acidiceleris TaxID=371036 RepID=UPI000B42EBCD|nr:3-oxoacyl-[acyl-carrier-protein] synthase III C-terminal domain-containing protein [Gottfriedia acidiceleris]